MFERAIQVKIRDNNRCLKCGNILIVVGVVMEKEKYILTVECSRCEYAGIFIRSIYRSGKKREGDRKDVAKENGI